MKRLPIVSDPALMLPATPEGQSAPTTLTPVRNNTPGPHGTDTPTLPGLPPRLQLAWQPHRARSQTRRRRWTLSPSRGQSHSSRGHHGVEEQVILLLLAHP